MSNSMINDRSHTHLKQLDARLQREQVADDRALETG